MGRVLEFNKQLTCFLLIKTSETVVMAPLVEFPPHICMETWIEFCFMVLICLVLVNADIYRANWLMTTFSLTHINKEKLQQHHILKRFILLEKVTERNE